MKESSDLPCLVKLTPNVTDICHAARAANAGGADGVSLINTVNSIVSVDLDLMAPEPTIDGKGSHGGYCGPAVKPMALFMVTEIAKDPETSNLPISAIGGISNWRDATEFIVGGVPELSVASSLKSFLKGFLLKFCNLTSLKAISFSSMEGTVPRR